VEKRNLRKLLMWIIIFGLLTPLGLVTGGSGWGEWALEEIEEMYGLVPDGMRSLWGMWGALLPDYSIPIPGGRGSGALGYIFSTFIGVVLIVLSSILIEKIIARKK